MSTRSLIVVDVETTGLDNDSHVLEIAAIRASDREELHIVPPPPMFQREHFPALAVNRYIERGVWKSIDPPLVERDKLCQLAEWINGNTFAGSNPRFDLAVLEHHYLQVGLEPPKPHYRLADLSAFIAGHSQMLKATELPGLNVACGMLSVPNHEPHSAMGDARATLECFRKLGAT